MPKRKNKDGTCYACGSEHELRRLYQRSNSIWSLICRSCNNLKSKKHYDKSRALVFEYYGSQCACCHEKEQLFLTVDHVNNDGYEERWHNGNRITGVHIYPKIVKAGYPKKYQLLCMNCNHGKRMNNGVCPHEMVK